MFERILIANRGEVAARVARTCRRLGIETVGVHVLGEEDELHVEACDESILLGDRAAAHLDPNVLLAAAREAKVHAVHAGYGTIAHDASLLRALADEGIVFVGPAPEALEIALNRLAVRRAAEEAGVRLLPGSETPILEPNDALAEVDRIGYPVVVKAVRGAGVPAISAPCEDVAALSEALSALEPLEAHGGAYLERWVDLARHVEVELLFDGTDAVVLADREVSLHKGGMRLVSESPACALDQLRGREAVRGALWDASCEIATKLGCRGLVSCHFVLDEDGTFYFVGFSTGLSVEHPTTEMCAGIDLVEMQLRIATDESMPEEVLRFAPTGAALTAHVYASTDPRTGRPFESRVESARWPPAPQGKIRIESGVRIGSVVLPEHDPLVATVTAYAPNRHDAVLMLDRILAEIHIGPLVTNLRLLRKALNHQSFLAGQYDDAFVERI